jgi:hypothetical protein
MNIAEIRNKYPQYNDLDDNQLAGALHKKYYADIPLEQFTQKIGVELEQPKMSRLENYRNAAVQRLGKVGTGIYGYGVDIAEAAGLDPEVAKEAKGIVSEARQKIIQQNPVQSGAETIAADIIANPFTFTPGGLVKGAALSSGLDSMIEADPALAASEKAKSGVTGALTGAAIGYGLGKIAKPITNQLSPEAKRLAKVAQQEGIPLTAAQATGSKGLGLLEAGFETLPFTAGRQARIAENQFQKLTQSALKKAGVEAMEASPEVIEKAYNDIGGRIGSITKSVNMPIDDLYVGDIIKVVDEYANVIDPLRRPQFEAIASEITKGAALGGEAYQKTRSQLGRMAKSLYNSDPNYANALEGLQEAMDNAVQRVLPQDSAKALQTARKQYASIKTIMKAASSTAKDSTSGLLTPTALQNAVKVNNPTAYVTGSGELNDLARAGGLFLKKSIPDSGTASRSAMQDLLQGRIGTAALGGGIGYASGGTEGAATGAAIGAGLPIALQRAYQTPLIQSYLKNGLPVPESLLIKISKMLATQGNE